MIRAAALASALALAAASAHAQDAGRPPLDSDHPGWSEFLTFMRGARELALMHMGELQCGDAPCSPATPQELASPPISDSDLIYIGVAAIRSAMAEHCGLDWESASFGPLMAEWRGRPGLENRDFALVAAVHGVAQERILQAEVADGPCDDETRTDLQAAMR